MSNNLAELISYATKDPSAANQCVLADALYEQRNLLGEALTIKLQLEQGVVDRKRLRGRVRTLKPKIAEMFSRAHPDYQIQHWTRGLPTFSVAYTHEENSHSTLGDLLQSPFRFFLTHVEANGPNIDQMPVLLNHNLEVASLGDILTGRRTGLLHEDRWYDTSCGAIFYPDGSLQLVPHCKEFLEYIHRGRLDTQTGTIRLTEEECAHLPGIVYQNREDLGPLNQSLPEELAQEHLFWQFADADQARREKNISHIYRRLRNQHNRTQGMGVYLNDFVPSHHPAGRLWDINYLNYDSGAGGDVHVDDANGGLAGVAPEAQMQTHLTAVGGREK